MTSACRASGASRSTRASRSNRGLAAAVVVVLALTTVLVLGATADAASSDAARVVEAMRAAAGDQDFSATVEVTWRTTSGDRKQSTVDVRAVDGVFEITSGDQMVVEEDGHTFVRDDLDWWTPAKEPRPSGRPSPDARWSLALERGSTLGRPTTAVVASRADGSVGQRLLIDDATNVLVGRDVVARNGSVERGFRFTSFSVVPGTAGARRITASPSATERDAAAIRDVPDEFAAPDVVGAGYRLVSRSRSGDGVQLAYSDGLFTLSVREQPGELDWGALPAGGTSMTVDGARARRYAQPLGDVIVWERDGIVFTCVSDAPRDVYVAAVSTIASGPGVVERAVDFVLGPFGFD